MSSDAGPNISGIFPTELNKGRTMPMVSYVYLVSHKGEGHMVDDLKKIPGNLVINAPIRYGIYRLVGEGEVSATTRFAEDSSALAEIKEETRLFGFNADE